MRVIKSHDTTVLHGTDLFTQSPRYIIILLLFEGTPEDLIILLHSDHSIGIVLSLIINMIWFFFFFFIIGKTNLMRSQNGYNSIIYIYILYQYITDIKYVLLHYINCTFYVLTCGYRSDAGVLLPSRYVIIYYIELR